MWETHRNVPEEAVYSYLVRLSHKSPYDCTSYQTTYSPVLEEWKVHVLHMRIACGTQTSKSEVTDIKRRRVRNTATRTIRVVI